MRQVPTKYQYLLVGGGRLATHMKAYLSYMPAPILLWNRQEHSPQQLIEFAESAQNILLCVSDDQIEAVWKQIGLIDKNFIHFSGTFSHESILGFHPLMTFSQENLSLMDYKKIHFVGSHDEEVFRSCFPLFGNTYSQIFTAEKGLYHSLCVLGGNGTTLIWELIQREFNRLGIPREAVEVYLNKIIENIVKEKEGRFTGPWYRHDKTTIAENKKALENSPLKNLYDELEQLSPLMEQEHEKNHRL